MVVGGGSSADTTGEGWRCGSSEPPSSAVSGGLRAIEQMFAENAGINFMWVHGRLFSLSGG